MIKKITKETVNEIPFLRGGVLYYFTGDKKFLYFRKQYKSTTNQDIKLARQRSTPITLSPLEVLCCVLRESITEKNIAAFYKHSILRFDSTSEEFLKKYLSPHYMKRFTKYKGTIHGDDFWVKEYRHFEASPRNMAIFQM